MRVIVILPLFVLTACASFPQLDAAMSKTIGPRPALLTLDQITALTSQDTKAVPNTAAQADDLMNDLPARATALRSR